MAIVRDQDKERNALDLFRETVLKNRQIIYVCGYPRSGTTWLTRLLAQCLDSPSLSWSENNDIRLPQFRDPAVEGLHRHGPYVVRHGHWASHQRKPGKEKVLYMVRDPRDLAVSNYHYFTFRNDPDGLSKCVGQMCGERGKILNVFRGKERRGWAGHVGEWLNTKVFYVSYEDLLRLPEETIVEAIAKLGLPSQPKNRVARAIKNNLFKNRPKDKTMRRGVIGGWRDELSDELEKQLCRRCGDVMVRLGYLSEQRYNELKRSKPTPVPEPKPEIAEPVVITRPKPKRVPRHSLPSRRWRR